MHFKQTPEKGQKCETTPRLSALPFFRRVFTKSLLLLVFLSGKVGVSCEVEGMVIQVSTSGAAQHETMKTTTTCRLLLLVKVFEPNRWFFTLKSIEVRLEQRPTLVSL